MCGHAIVTSWQGSRCRVEGLSWFLHRDSGLRFQSSKTPRDSEADDLQGGEV